ncbi:MAG TPA: hypothetical protein PKA09_11400 [Geminicoccus sp.]|nr:hypothetical protein [Geminicoccus sp.]
MAVAAPATAADLCPRLTIPAELGLACAPIAGDPLGVAVEPAAGGFAALSRMTVRQLEQKDDPLAWADPDEWLRQQVVIDTGGLADSIERFADDPDAPWGGATAMLLAESVRQALESVGRAALQVCTAPAATATARSMGCRFGVGSLGLLLDLKLVSIGNERWAVSARSMNERRQRHFEAIANSLTAN